MAEMLSGGDGAGRDGGGKSKMKTAVGSLASTSAAIAAPLTGGGGAGDDGGGGKKSIPMPSNSVDGRGSVDVVDVVVVDVEEGLALGIRSCGMIGREYSVGGGGAGVDGGGGGGELGRPIGGADKTIHGCGVCESASDDDDDDDDSRSSPSTRGATRGCSMCWSGPAASTAAATAAVASSATTTATGSRALSSEVGEAATAAVVSISLSTTCVKGASTCDSSTSGSSV